VLKAFESHDSAAFRQLVAADARMRIESPCEGPGDFVGAEAVTQRFARSTDLLAPGTTVSIKDVLASDSHAAVLFEVDDGRSDGSPARRVAVYRMSRGRITEIRVHQEPSRTLNA
jgi:ketosteroid isomerase-like protein